MISLKFFLYIFAAGASIFFILNDTIISRVRPPDFEVLETEEPPFLSIFNTTVAPEPSQHCALPKLDPWDQSIKQFFDSHKDPKSHCKPVFERRSSVSSDGILLVNDSKNGTIEDENCYYRCLYAVDDRNLRFGNWTIIRNKTEGATPQCDVFDVQCTVGNNVTYKFLHSQIFEEELPPGQIPIEAPDVHIIVIDSVSMSQFFRSMPITTHYLRTENDAIVFPHLNKVGLNSRPNAYGFLMGERSENLERNPWGQEHLHGRGNELCQNALDKENFVVFDFQKRGYRTMMNEDWAIGIFNWPNCKGFTRKPADHFMKPFALRYDGRDLYKDKELRKDLFSRSCLEQHDYMLDTLEDFLNKYPNQPKFSLSWMTAIAHDDWNGLYHVDDQFKKFFVRNKQKLSNSYVILMGDHGGRTGKVRQTLVGELEDNNPFFVVMLPEQLRGNTDITTQLYRNSKEIITHYDIYATLLEIANGASTWTRETKLPSATYTHPNRTLIGSSLFRSLKQPRTCDSLLIPFGYCICQHNYTLVDQPKIGLQIANQAVGLMNQDVAASEYRDKCAPLTVDREKTMEMQLQEFDQQEGKRIFRTSFRVLPSGGLYDAFAEYRDGKTHLLTKRFPRHDRYAEQTKCIPENFIRNYCFCKDLLHGVKQT
ncbi:hypothetical protein M3Y97_00112900 [Aphelenchoides bicaudatus]|nr:hypothetical protein M3Y97_00112900 [Aphelenchoides bicaudatus]